MSAYVVSKKHIRYLVKMALALAGAQSGGLTWRTAAGEWLSLRASPSAYEEAAAIGRMLWEENIRSVCARYPTDTRQNLPGPVGETYSFTELDITQGGSIEWECNPVEILAAINCYRYQSCEHDAWETSEAFRFVAAMESAAIRRLPGYEAAPWGAPLTTEEKRAEFKKQATPKA